MSADPKLHEAFEARYKALNKAQKEAVDIIEGPVMVIAGPGTGKTSILTLRIANILKKTDTPASGILAITYTDAGVKAMREKLHAIIGNRAHDINIHTFHSFASSIIAEYPDHFLSLMGMKRMTEIEQETLINQIITDPAFIDIRPIGKPDAYVNGIIRSIEESKREAVTPDMVRELAEKESDRIKSDEGSITSRGATKGQLKAEAKEAIEKCQRTILFADVYERYEQEKRKAKKMDFNDLIIELLVALRNDELLLRLIQERFLYIHVDEHQDTNDAQNFIIALIAEFFETPNIFIVGDEKQAIYRFQGASVENFLLLRKRWPAMKVISLEKNYRSHQSILDASFSMIENNYEAGEHEGLRIRLSSGGKEKAEPINIVTGENVASTEQYLVKQLKSISKDEPESTVAIITRRNRDLDRVIRLLESHGIAVSSERSVDIFNHPVGALFFDLIEYLSDPTRLDALAKTVIAGMWNMPFEKGAELVGLLRSGRSEETDTRLPALKLIRTRLLSDGAVGFLIHSAEGSGFLKLVSTDPSYVHVWRGIIALAESLARDGDIRQPIELMKQMLAYRASAESKTVKVTVGAPDVPFQAMTAHGSKGLEFDHVFIPYATEEAWVSRARGASFVLPKKRAADNDIRDVRRLFYVAITRARSHVSILVPLEESDGKALVPLRFISELDPKHVNAIELPRADVEAPQGNTKSVNEVVASKFVDIAKRVLTSSGLSVTALNHFMDCPSKFLYQSILKIPQAPSVPAEKGNAMHFALSFVWASKERGQKDIETILIEKLNEYLSDSLLPALEKEAVKKELIHNAPEVAKALVPHFAIQGQSYTESWVKTVFDGSYDGKDIQIPIHGKMDAIVDTKDEVAVFDYKTRQALSVNAIKGETKSSDGSYFRQLVFYRMLLSSDPRWRTRKVIPSLVFVSPDEKGRCPTVTLPIAEEDIAQVKGEIKSLIESVWSGAIAYARCDDAGCEWCGLKHIWKN